MNQFPQHERRSKRHIQKTVDILVVALAPPRTNDSSLEWRDPMLLGRRFDSRQFIGRTNGVHTPFTQGARFSFSLLCEKDSKGFGHVADEVRKRKFCSPSPCGTQSDRSGNSIRPFGLRSGINSSTVFRPDEWSYYMNAAPQCNKIILDKSQNLLRPGNGRGNVAGSKKTLRNAQAHPWLRDARADRMVPRLETNNSRSQPMSPTTAFSCNARARPTAAA